AATLSSTFFLVTTTPPTKTSTLSLHDALPIYQLGGRHRGGTLGVHQTSRDRLRLDFLDVQSDAIVFDLDHDRLAPGKDGRDRDRSEEHTSEFQSRGHLVCRLLLEKKKSLLCRC